MKKEIWGFNVIGPQGLDARNDFAVGPNDEGDDVVLRVNQVELTGKEFETLKEIAEGGPVPGGGGFPEQDLDDPTFVPEANHYYKQKAGEKPGPTLQPFEVGDVLKVGDKIHFDITKEAELLAWMKTLEYEKGSGTSHQMVYTHIEESGSSYDIDILNAYCLPGERFGIENNVYLLKSDIVGLQDTDGAVYISEDLTSLSPALTQGFHTDANGDVTIVEYNPGVIEYPVNEVIDTNPPAWNGIFAGVMEEPPASQFTDGVLYFYDGEEYHAITGEGGEGTLDYNKLENVPIINLTENKTTVLSPFEVGQALNSESVLHIDTNKEEEFLSYLQTLEYPEQFPVAAFMRAKRTADSALILLLAGRQDNVYTLAIGRVGEDSNMLYVSQDYYDEQTSTQYYKGFQNLDANGNLQFTQLLTPADGDFIIEQIVDTNPPTWNGTIISAVTEETVVSPTPVDGEFYKRNGQIYKYTAAKPGESQPELYDKVVLESELGGGSGAVVIDLGELHIQEGQTNVKVDITEEQFNLANNNDNVIVKAFINISDAYYVYLPKVATLPAGESTAESMFAASFEGMSFFAGLFYNDNQEKYVCEFNIQEESGDDTQLYRHTIIISPSTGSMLGQLHCNLTFVSTRSTAYTNNDVQALVDDLGSMVAVSGAAIYNGSIAVLERARFQNPLSSSQLIGKYFVLNTDAQVSYMSDYYIDNIPEMSIYQDTVQPIQ